MAAVVVKFKVSFFDNVFLSRFSILSNASTRRVAVSESKIRPVSDTSIYNVIFHAAVFRYLGHVRHPFTSKPSVEELL